MWLLYSPPVPLVPCGSIGDLPRHADGVLGVWLSSEQGDVAEWLIDLRRYSPYAHLPVFADCRLPDALQQYCDGQACTAESALEQALEWRSSISRLQGTSPGPGLALVRYLYLRPLLALLPVREWARRQAYYYPLVEAFVDGESPESLLDALKSRGWLEQTHLVDRLRRCGACHSVHLNYVDVCPGCQGINIEEAAYIHCFTCSHLAPEGSFARQEALVCPNCHERLRHIGVDYNRPLEQFYCRDCAMAFPEAEVIAKCLECEATHDPAVLPTLRIGSYALSEAGRHAARSGGIGAGVVPNPRGCSVSMDAFVEMAEWIASMSHRHPDAGYVLLGLQVSSSSKSDAAPVGAEGGLLLNTLSDCIRRLMRGTDILCWSDDGQLWILLPHTDRCGGNALLQKILRLVEGAAHEGGSHVDIRSVARSSEDIPLDTSVGQVLESLRRQLHGEVSC